MQNRNDSVCTIFAASGVKYSKRTEFPLFLVLTFFLRTRVEDIPTFSSKVKKNYLDPFYEAVAEQICNIKTQVLRHQSRMVVVFTA